MCHTSDEARVGQQKECIAEVYQETWKVESPRRFQIDTTHNVVFVEKPFINGCPQVTALIQKTGEGKSNVLLASAALRGGLTLCIVPIVGLASDQLFKSSCRKHGIYAYNIHDLRPGMDETKRAQEEIKSLIDDRKRSVILFATPGDLVNKDSVFWRDCVYESIKNETLRFICLDECHAIHEDGIDYRPEFLELKEKLIKPLVQAKHEIPILAMSATFTTNMQKDFETAMGLTITERFWGDMDRRSIDIEVIIAYQVTKEWKKVMTPYLHERGTKILFYTNSAHRARRRINDHIQSLLKDEEINGDVMEFVGDKTSVLKEYMLRLFSGNLESEHADLRVLIATKAANCGVHSSHCSLLIREGIPSALHEFCQEIGRIARGPRPVDALPDKCYIALTIDLVLSSVLCVLKEARVKLRERKLGQLLKTLQLLVTPTRCLHVTLEEEFESPENARDRHECGDRCPHCRGEHLNFAGGAVKKDYLINTLLVDAFLGANPSTEDLVRTIRDKSDKIWVDRGDEEAVPVGKIECLLLQLLANGVLEVFLDRNASEKASEPRLKDLRWRWCVCEVGQNKTYACYDDARWAGIVLG